MLTPIFAKILKTLPTTKFGDYIFHWVLFLRAHKRRPANTMLLNDYLFRMKTSSEILNPLRQFVSDKFLVKHYVRAIIGEQYNIETIRLLTSKKDVDAYEFPATCCIKPSHASGRFILRRNGEPIDKAEIKSWLDINYYYSKREVNYRYNRPGVIVEPIVFEGEQGEDYKFFCYNGKVGLLELNIGRHENNLSRKYFDAELNEQSFSKTFPKNTDDFPLPANMPEMMKVAEKLSAEFSFIRVDLYSNGKTIYVGELTNCPMNAGNIFIPRGAEADASRLIFGPAENKA